MWNKQHDISGFLVALYLLVNDRIAFMSRACSTRIGDDC